MLQLLFILLCLHKPCCLSRCPDAYLDVPCSTPSQYPLLICLSPHHSVVTLSRSPTISSVKITDRSFSYASPRLWNQLPDSFRQRLASHVSTHLFIHLSAHLYYHHHHSHHPSLLHSFTPGSKPTVSTNPPHLNTPSTLHCLHDHGTGSDLSRFSIYF